MKTELFETHLGDLIAALYEEFYELYGDEEIASVATAATINDLLTEAACEPVAETVAA